jgi:hypothetical protein
VQNGGEPEHPEERARRALAHLGNDAASAPAVPAEVTARIGAALRAAPPPAAHGITRVRPRLGRHQIIAVIIGVGAAAAAITVRALALPHTWPPTRTSPSAPGDTPKAVVTRP